MDSVRLARLTEQQRVCLRHVYAHMTSKEIAPLLGIEPNSVDQHIKAAMRVLGVADRRVAARMLALYEGDGAAQPLVYQPLDIAIAPEPAMLGSSTEGERYGGSLGEAMREEQAVFTATLPSQSPMLPLPMRGARLNDVGWLTRLAWIAGITIGIAFAFGALVAGVEGLAMLIWS